MALIKCPKCGNEISEKALKCPKCGMNLLNSVAEAREKGGNNNLLKAVIGILSGISVILVLIIIFLLKDDQMGGGRSGTIQKKEEKIIKQESSNDLESDQVFKVNKEVYDDEYATITCDSVNSRGITFLVTSKMKSRVFSIIISNVSLDGLGVDFQNYNHGEVQPGETIEYTIEGKVKYLEHNRMSLSGDLYDDTGSGFVSLDICDFDLGGKENLEYEEKGGIEQFASDHMTVRYIGASGKGLEFRVINRDRSAFNIVCDVNAK